MTGDAISIITVYVLVALASVIAFLVPDEYGKFYWALGIVVMGQYPLARILFRTCKLCGKRKFMPNFMFEFLPPDSACVHCHGDDNLTTDEKSKGND
jgi:hypothetical protein